MSLSIRFKFPDWKGELAKAEDEINLFIAAQIQFNRGMLFDSEGRYNGRPGWAPLKFRKGKILQDRGTLRRSLAPMNGSGAAGPNGVVRFESSAIVIGTTLIYARLMNDGTTKMPGGRMVPVNAKALKIPLPSGKNATQAAKDARKSAKTLNETVADGTTRKGKFLFVNSVKIPARPFDDWNDEDQAELNDALVNKIAEVLRRG
jgi:phage gpG-like protein